MLALPVRHPTIFATTLACLRKIEQTRDRARPYGLQETAISPNAGSSQFRKGATVNSILRKIVCTGVHSQLVAITIPPGAETEEEAQGTSDQVVFVVEGAGKAILNGQVEVAGEHDAIFIPAGTVHKFKNSGASDLKIFVTSSPPVTADTVPRCRYKTRKAPNASKN